MSDLAITDLPIVGLDWLFSPPGLLLVDKGAQRATSSFGILGDAGAGKTTLAVAIAHGISRALGGVTQYITTELASAELRYKAAFLGLEQLQVLLEESKNEARAGDMVAQHLALLENTGDPESSVQEEALQAALRLTEDTIEGGLPVTCVVIDAFPMPGTSSMHASARDGVVRLTQILEGRGVSVVIVAEDGGTQDYLPFIVDVVLEARFEREPSTRELTRTISCRKSRYTISLPGPHDAGIDNGRPSVWPNPLAVVADEQNVLDLHPVEASFLIPLPQPEQVCLFRGGTVLASPFDKGSALPALLHATPGVRPISVDCGPITIVQEPGGPRSISIPEWEGPYSIGWTLLRACGEWDCNAVVIFNLEGFVADPKLQRKFAHVVAALRMSGIIVCLHGREEVLRDIYHLASYVWEGKRQGAKTLSRTTHRRVADWFALESWPVLVAPKTASGRASVERVRSALLALKALSSSGSVEEAKHLLDSSSPSVNEEATIVARAQLAVGYHLLGATRDAEQRLPAAGADPVLRPTSNAWAAALIGYSWRACRDVVGQLPKAHWAGSSAPLLWSALVAIHAGNTQGVEQLRAAVATQPVAVPLLLRALAAQGKWEEIDQFAVDLRARHNLPSFFAERICADARLEGQDEAHHSDAERRLAKLTLESLPRVHAADTWHNLGVARASLGHAESAVQCWKRALEINPMLELAQDRLEGRDVVEPVPADTTQVES